MNQAFDIHVLKNAVYESASTIKDLRKGVKVFSKKHEVDLVTEADLRSEEILAVSYTHLTLPTSHWV